MGEDGRPDLINRDPNNLNGSLTVAFEDIFGEPDGVHSPDCAYKCGFMCYEGAKSICYKIITVLCTWLYGFCWGCQFAYVTCCYIWMFTPTIRMLKLVCGTCQSIYATCVECCLVPLCSSCGALFSNIKVTQS
ncbi:CAV1 [Bugula neritina]|uniref:Caveolin n=1 Tax=Bugula neritina TaxID=10212 RepID=A0A7J7JUX5_BUGNE|nr:CAV1 [Bugula neritina]